MSTTPRWSTGRFIWHEIVTPDVEATKTFYASLVGWKYELFEGDYPMIVTPSGAAGGVFDAAQIPGKVPPHFMGYVSVENVDAIVDVAKAEGATVMKEPFDIPNVGRIAIFDDATGAGLAVIHPSTADGQPPGKPQPGDFCWDQLNSRDVDLAKRFWSKVFGWTLQPFGGGASHVFALPTGTPVGGLVQAPADVPSHWLTYVQVDNLAAATARATKGGGKVYVEQAPVPGMGTLAVIGDNVGAVVGLFEASAA